MKILIVNVGSTSLKYKLFRFPEEDVLAQGRLERIGEKGCPVALVGRSGKERKLEADLPDYGAAIDLLVGDLLRPDEGVLESLGDVSAVGFKTVHAGPQSLGVGAKYLDKAVLEAMEKAVFAASAHNPPYIKAIETFAAKLPKVPMVGLFEPAFHTTVPPKAYVYGLPYEWLEKYGIRHYGFHGASHRYIAERTPQFLGIPENRQEGFRVISCHLGGSSSLCAVRGGKSMDTTMGYSPQSGLPHSSRCETVDCFAVLQVMKEEGWSPDDVSKILCKQSGLMGISGISGDMRDIEEAAGKGSGRAALALEVFVYQVQKQIGAMAVAAGGLDALVFTGGIGERGISIRASICEGLGFLGVALDAKKNKDCFGEETVISPVRSPVAVAVIPTNEELVVARETARLLAKG